MAIIGYIEQSDFEIILKHVLASNGDETFSTDQSTIIAYSLTFAYNSIISTLISRGYIQTNIDQWARRKEFQTEMAIYEFIKLTGKQRKSDNENSWWSVYNRSKELETIKLISDAGAIIEPVLTYDRPLRITNILDINEKYE
jgi:hypothetical protein